MGLSFRAAVGLTPVLVVLHNLEEFPRIVAYARRHGIELDLREFGVAVGFASALPFPLTALVVRSPKQSRSMFVGLLVPAIMAANAASHVAQTILFRDYSPGTITALGLNVPFAIYLYRRAVREGYLRPDQLRTLLLSGALLMAPSALGLLLLGRLVARQA